MKLIYHYAPKVYLERILASKKLMVSEFEKKNKISPPGLWLSTNPIWENTATKSIFDDGVKWRLTKEEQHEIFGLIRFVMEFKKENLCSWRKYKHVSNTPLQHYEQLAIVGIEQNANPEEWFVSFQNIPLSNCISCEEWNGESWQVLIDFKKQGQMA